MQYEVHPTYQTGEIDLRLNGSFKYSTRRTKNFLKNQPDFSRTCGFRGEFTERLNFQIKTSNISNPGLDFRQKRLKVEKPLKKAVFGTVSSLLND